MTFKFSKKYLFYRLYYFSFNFQLNVYQINLKMNQIKHTKNPGVSQRSCNICVHDSFWNKLQELEKIKLMPNQTRPSSLRLLLVLIHGSHPALIMLQQPRDGGCFSEWSSLP